MENYFKKSAFKPEVTHGVCPTCQEHTMLVSITKDFYRCVTCGADLEQKINGDIKYIPKISITPEYNEKG